MANIKGKQITIRFSASQLAVLEQIAADDQRPLAYTVRYLTILAAKRRRPEFKEQLDNGMEDGRSERGSSPS